MLGGPTGILVATYRLRLPPDSGVTVETIHSAFRITRDNDKPFIPPGRLRHYDLIVFDEVSQIDAHVWCQLQTALSELSPCPYVVFAGDFQQLQPVMSKQQLQEDLERERLARRL
eukprot:3746695-Amphidinium_carterae.1